MENFWNTFKYEINLILTWSKDFYSFCNWGAKLAITGTKLYVPIVTLSTQENVKLLEQIECCFKRITSGINIYQKGE